MKKLFTSESVTEGHPDKVCDQISDSILDAILAQDPSARVACECATTTGMVLIMGEITANASVDFTAVARETIKEIGYNGSDVGFDANTCVILTAIDKQSVDIALGVDKSYGYDSTKEAYEKTGAGDQGMMFGFATNETEELMPLALMLSHKLTKKLAEIRKDSVVDYLRPDGKAQVTVEYDDDKIKRIDAIVLSTQHNESIDISVLRADMKKLIIDTVIPSKLMDKDTKIYINPTGRFVIGGPHGDSGLTGRKIIVDSYGGYSAHGGGAFSGKDPTKVDRSGAYYARYVAKNIVASGIADKCEIQLAYAIGVSHPVSINVNTFNTGKIDDTRLEEIIEELFDFRPKAIIDQLKLTTPVYKKTASYGHFGNSEFSWEKTDRTEELRKLANIN